MNNYNELSDNLKAGLKFLAETDFSKLACGRYDILGNEVYASVQEYNTKPLSEGKYEAHKVYTDIQFIVEGEENIGIENIKNCSNLTEYNKDNDFMFLSIKSESDNNFINLKRNEFAILTPNDAHMPSISVNEASKHVKKVVVKARQ